MHPTERKAGGTMGHRMVFLASITLLFYLLRVSGTRPRIQTVLGLRRAEMFQFQRE